MARRRPTTERLRTYIEDRYGKKHGAVRLEYHHIGGSRTFIFEDNSDVRYQPDDFGTWFRRYYHPFHTAKTVDI